MNDINDICEIRPFTNEELARVTVSQRKDRGWTQETLAEIARLEVRRNIDVFVFTYSEPKAGHAPSRITTISNMM
jgi:hypothetical protein